MVGEFCENDEICLHVFHDDKSAQIIYPGLCIPALGCLGALIGQSKLAEVAKIDIHIP